MLAEQEVRAHLLWVQMCHEWLRIFGQTGCEDDQFVDLVHAFKELGNKWTHQDVDSAYLAVYLDRKHNVSVLNWLER